MSYYFKTTNYKDVLFPTVDATYVIHLKENGRYKNVKKQLKKYSLTNKVHILVNKGYKKCIKPNIDSPAKDLIDAYMYCFTHAKQYNTIMILEDDFIIDPTINQHTDNINNFVKSHKDFIYRLGCIPAIMIPYDKYNYIGLSGGTHAIMYSLSLRNELLNKKDEIYNCDYDLYLNRLTNYIYYKPVIYQLFPTTESQENWGKFNIFAKKFAFIIIKMIQLFKLDKQINPGYNFFYFISKFTWILLF